MSEQGIEVHCVTHGHGMYGCTITVDGRIAKFVDGQFDGSKTLAEIEAHVLDCERITRAEPVIVTPEYARILRDRRVERHISLGDIAPKLRMGIADFSDMEFGRTPPPSYKIAYLWARFVGLSHDEAEALFKPIEPTP